MTDLTYTDRTLQHLVVKSTTNGLQFEDPESKYGGWSFGGHASLRDLKPGDHVRMETHRTGQVVGAQDMDGEWLYRKSDQLLDAEHDDMVAGFARDRQRRLRRNRDDWTRRERLLPRILQDRLQGFRDAAGDKFETDGWGYELVICELAAAYAADDGWYAAYIASGRDAHSPKVIDPLAVKAISQREGTSGNQHEVAMLLARVIREQPADEQGAITPAMVPSGLAPLTGSRDYS